ncbi:MAG TPA: hemerythrin domain-containing protein [Kofleriaceae bacterium]|nr:hemerythrin domain-containing protein [Kofleriaceae bacterium]
MTDFPRSRRDLLAGGVTLALAALVGCRRDDDSGELDVSAGEDLMREHGVLERLIVVYDAAARRLDAGDRSVQSAIGAAARIAREFVEDYHERIEERYVFPRFERANQLVELVAVLRRQHDAGRGLTDHIAALARGALASAADRAELAAALRGYGAMFVPHVGREDTLVFPAFHQLVGKEYADLGDQFEDEERARFGVGGFEQFVARLPAIEAAVGVADLAHFTVTVDDLARSRS